MPETVQGAVAADRVREFLRQHGVRLAAAVVIAACAVMLANAAPPAWTAWLVLGPLMFGACVPLVSRDALSGSVNAWEEYFDRSLSNAQSREGKFARYFLRPLHAGSLKLWKLSEPAPSPHVRAGIRLAAAAYFWAAMVSLLVAAVYIIVSIVVLMMVLAVISWFLNRNDPAPGRGGFKMPAGGKGTFFKGSHGLTQKRAGSVDARGRVYEGSTALTEKRVGRVAKDGTILEGSSVLTEKRVGQIDASGKVYSGNSSLTDKRVGRVDEDGNVLAGSSVLTEKTVGKIERDKN